LAARIRSFTTGNERNAGTILTKAERSQKIKKRNQTDI